MGNQIGRHNIDDGGLHENVQEDYGLDFLVHKGIYDKSKNDKEESYVKT